MSFKVKDSNLYRMPGSAHLMHLATIEDGFHEYIAMVAIAGPHKGNCYIEEVVLNTVSWTDDVFANLKFIEDDNLAFDLAKFCEEKGITDVPKRLNELAETGRISWLTDGEPSSLITMKK
jgi:hypothetical protein